MKHMYAGAVLLLAMFACNNTPETSPESSPAASVTTVPPRTSLELGATGQIEFLYYPNPKDQKTYRKLAFSDTSLISLLSSNIMRDTIAQSECPHDVKMFFIRNGEVFKTIYAATADSCRYFAYAVNSNPFYTRMDERSFLIIDSLKKKAR